VGKIDARIKAGLQDHLAVLAFDHFAVNGDSGHGGGMLAKVAASFTVG
jgi:hypothetical protein